MAYSYDPNGNLLTRVDARDVTTTYGYDNLNRNTAVSYNDGVTPGINRYYDGAISNGKGRLHYSISYNSHPLSGYAYSITQINGYDAMGRVSSQQQGFLNSAGTQWYYYPVSRTYNLAGNVLTQTYPSNRTATYGYNAAAQLTSFTGTLGDGGSRNYATGITYTPAGLMSRETFGMQAATLYHNLHYNNRQQLVDIRVGDSSTDEWNWSRGALIYYYGTTARDSWNAFANSADNNGNVLRQVNYVPLSGGGYVIPQLDDYSYDALNRNTSVTEAQQNSSGSWTFNLFTQNFGYDRWGNRTVSCSPCQAGVTGDTFTIDTATNRITARNGMGMAYDAAGNQTYDTVGNRWFDGENRMYKAVQGGTTSHYVYDADGKRARRIIGSTETWMVYGIDGELVAEYAANGSAGSPQKEYGYRGGQMLIVAQASPLEIRWTVTDHLGTPRMNIRGTGADGGSLASVTRHDYLPFGEELLAGVGIRSSSYGYEPPADGVRQKFGSKERDNETGLDYFGARYFAPVQGRFTSVDPLLLSAKTAQPQTWNRYTYTLNNPLVFVDPSGEAPQQANNRTASSSNGRTRGEADFAIKHPVAATRIGRLDETGRSDNISTIAARFTNRIGLQEGDRTFDGSQVNAARHALWQAVITREFGADIAAQAGAAHERNPHVDLSVNTFGGNNALAEADQTIDLLNNQIGRDIANANPNASPQQLALAAVQYFYTQGLFTATQNADGSVTVTRTRITGVQLDNASSIIIGLNNNGRTTQEQRRHEEEVRRELEQRPTTPIP